jgi:hypothetical protein
MYVYVHVYMKTLLMILNSPYCSCIYNNNDDSGNNDFNSNVWIYKHIAIRSYFCRGIEATEEFLYKLGDKDFRIIVCHFQSLYLGPIKMYATPAQKETFMKPFLHGEKVGCFALSEPGTYTNDNIEFLVNCRGRNYCTYHKIILNLNGLPLYTLF